jgi:hypothetical protein
MRAPFRVDPDGQEKISFALALRFDRERRIDGALGMGREPLQNA